MKRTSRSD